MSQFSIRIGALLILRYASILFLFAFAGFAGAMQPGLPSPPIPCSIPPQVATLSFFELFESPKSELFVQKEAGMIFANRLLNEEGLQGVTRLLALTKREYSIDGYEAPLSQRLVGEPKIIEPGAKGWNPRGSVSVMLTALSSRGRVEQRISMECESGLWKVDSFSYGPPND